MKVILLNQYFPPDGSATANVFGDLASAFLDKGHDVLVVCGKASYGGGRFGVRESQDVEPGGLDVRRVLSFSFPRTRMLGRLANYFSFLFGALWTLRFRARGDVIVVGTDPPLAIMVAALAARGAPILYNVQDLHPDASVAAGLISAGPPARLWDRVHRWGLGRADLVVTIGRDMKDRVVSKGVPEERIEVIPNGADDPIGEVDPLVVKQLRGPARFVALHAGNIGSAVPWESLVAAGELLSKRGVEIVFLGEGIFADHLSERGVRVLPFRDSSQVPSVMSAGDVQIVALRAGLEGLLVPSKLYTALAYGRPIFAVAPRSSEVALVVEEYGCGVIADPADPRGIASALEDLARDPARLRAMGERSLAAALLHRRSESMHRLLRAVEGLGGGR